MISSLQKKQYIGHARHDGPYMENSLALYHYLVEELKYDIIEADIVFTLDGVPVLNHGVDKNFIIKGKENKINIANHTFETLKTFVGSATSNYLTTVEEYIKYGKEKGVIIMFDLTFQKYTYSHYKTLYALVSKYDMLDNVIWGDADILRLALLNRNLIVQVGGSWGRKLLFKSFVTSFFCKTTIMSFSYYGGNIESFQNIVRWGHRLGFIMKVATINDLDTANRFWKIEADLINTDKLINTNKAYEKGFDSRCI